MLGVERRGESKLLDSGPVSLLIRRGRLKIIAYLLRHSDAIRIGRKMGRQRDN